MDRDELSCQRAHSYSQRMHEEDADRHAGKDRLPAVLGRERHDNELRLIPKLCQEDHEKRSEKGLH